MRSDIAQSQAVARARGIGASIAQRDKQAIEMDGASMFLRSAGPVLRTLEEDLVGSGATTVLVDHECRIARLWFDEHDTEIHLEDLGLRIGVPLGEEDIGTSALGTVYELRKGMFVIGEEHYMQELQRFACYGHPIMHPLTKRVAGVLCLSTEIGSLSPLARALTSTAATGIESRLLGNARTDERDLLASYQQRVRKGTPLVALGHDLTLSNRAAAAMLAPRDVSTLRSLLGDPVSRSHYEVRLTLDNGSRARASVEIVNDGGILVSLEPISTTNTVSQGWTPTKRITWVHGEYGTGRSWTARTCAGDAPLTYVNSAALALEGVKAWREHLADGVADKGALCIEDIHSLPDELIGELIEMVPDVGHKCIVLTSTPPDTLSARAKGLVALADHSIALTALRNRRHEFSELTQTLLRGIVGTRSRGELDMAAFDALLAYPWPGNVRELRAALQTAFLRSEGGSIGLNDLPEHIRTGTARLPLGLMAQGERDAIVQALNSSAGNKSLAAKALGISRTTLYAKLRQLRIAV